MIFDVLIIGIVCIFLWEKVVKAKWVKLDPFKIFKAHLVKFDDNQYGIRRWIGYWEFWDGKALNGAWTAQDNCFGKRHDLYHVKRTKEECEELMRQLKIEKKRASQVGKMV